MKQTETFELALSARELGMLVGLRLPQGDPRCSVSYTFANRHPQIISTPDKCR